MLRYIVILTMVNQWWRLLIIVDSGLVMLGLKRMRDSIQPRNGEFLVRAGSCEVCVGYAPT